MLQQNNNRTNLPRDSNVSHITAAKSRDTSAHTKYSALASCSTALTNHPLRAKNTSQISSAQAQAISASTGLQSSTTYPKKARKGKTTSLAASKENNSAHEAMMGRAFKVIQNGAETSYKEGSMLSRHTHRVSSLGKSVVTPGKSSSVRPRKTATKSIFCSWAQPCACSKTNLPSSLVKTDQDHFNCVSCGALAFRTSVKTGVMSETRPVFTRDTLLEIICEVGDCLKQTQLTIHLSVEYMDRYLLLRHKFSGAQASQTDSEFASRIFEGHSADAVAISCLLLASKFDEIDDNIPLIEEFCKAHSLVRDSLDNGFLHESFDRTRLSQCRAYPTLRTMQRCELYLLNILCWDLNTITPLHFVLNHLYQGVVFSNDRPVRTTHHPSSDMTSEQIDSKMLHKVRRHVDYFAKLVLKQDFMLTKRFSDQTIAAATIYAARHASKVVHESWNQEAFKRLFGMSEPSKEVKECYAALLSATDQSTPQPQNKQQVKIEINLSRVDSESEPKQVETERHAHLETAAAKNLGFKAFDEISKHGQGSDIGEGLSTKGNEASHSENSGAENLTLLVTSQEEQGFSLAAEHSNNSTSRDNSSNEGIEAFADNRRKTGQQATAKAKQRQSASKYACSKSSSKVQARKPQQQSTAKSGKKSLPISRASIISTFEDQSLLKPCFVVTQMEGSKQVDKSLSPVKDFREEREGPIKIFKAYQQNSVVSRESRDRSSSSGSLFRLQPMIVSAKDDSKKQHAFLRASSTIQSEKSLAKRQSQKSTTPRAVIDFRQQGRDHNRQASRGQPGRVSLPKEQSREPSANRVSQNAKAPLLKLIQHQRSSLKLIKQEEEKRRTLSKSVIFSRNSDLSEPKSSEILEVAIGVDLTTPSNKICDTEIQDHQKDIQRPTSALLQLKAQAVVEFGQSSRNREQNFIRRNINYVTQLNLRSKERKSLVASHSFIECDPRTRLSTQHDEAKCDNQHQPEETEMSKLVGTNTSRQTASRAQKKASQQNPSTADKSKYLSCITAQNLTCKASKSPVQFRNLEEPLEPALLRTVSANVTPKNFSSYKPSKLFSKKTSVGKVTKDASIQENPRVSNPQVALHKFKAPQKSLNHHHQSSTNMTYSNMKGQWDTSQNKLSRCSVFEESRSYSAIELPITKQAMDQKDQKLPDSESIQVKQADADVQQKTDAAASIGSFSALAAGKCLPRNHLRPTKSSIMRAKSSMGLIQSSEGDNSGKSGGISGKSSIHNEIQVHVPEPVVKFGGQWQASRSSQNSFSPSFGAKTRKQKQSQRLSKQDQTGVKNSINEGAQRQTHPAARDSSTLSKIQIELTDSKGQTSNTRSGTSSAMLEENQQRKSVIYQHQGMAPGSKFASRRSSNINNGPQSYQATTISTRFNAQAQQSRAMVTAASKQLRDKSQLGGRTKQDAHISAAKSTKTSENQKMQVKAGQAASSTAAFRGTFQMR